MEKLERYKGELTFDQLILARSKIMENVESLYEEATLLYENQKFSRAYFLMCIANEELGKSLIVTSTIVDFIAGTVDWNTFWKSLRNHKDKTRMITYAEEIFASSEDNCRPLEEIRATIPTFEEVKMASLYSDMFQNDFFQPNEVIPEFLVTSYYRLTGKRIEFFSALMPSDNIFKEMKKEDIVLFRNKIHSMLKDYNDGREYQSMTNI